MKKLVAAALAILFVSALLMSCRSHQRCAAYGKVEPVNVEKPC